MAKKTWTDFIVADNDVNSPYEEGLVQLIQDNHTALKKTPFYLRWYKARADDADNKRDEWRTNATGGFFATRGGHWPLWILPGMDVLHVELLASVSAAGNVGNVEMDLVIAAQNQLPDTLHTENCPGVTSIFPAVTLCTFDWPRSELEDRWGRMARLRVRGTLTTRVAEASRLIVAEQIEPTSFWGQTP